MANLKWGAKGSAVKALQVKLNKAGAKPKVPVDGVFGEKTYAALKAFQKATPGLKVDGVADARTLAAFDAKPEQPRGKPPKARKLA